MRGNNLSVYEEVFSYEHLFEAGKKCCKNVRWKSSTQMFEIHLSTWVYNLHKQLMNGTYKPKKFKEFTINERGKKRKIKAMHISDRCVQKCLCEYYLKPLLIPKLIYDNCASVEGKGTEFAIKRLKHHLVQHYKKYGREGGILLLDYHDYFASINHTVLLKMLREDIDDDEMYEEVKRHVDSYSGDVGLGLGSETSQVLAVYYVNKVDHYVKEQLYIKGYGRYMDDFYAIHQDIDYLKHCWKEIEKVSAELGLELNPKSKICKLTDGFEYLKKRYEITDTGKVIIRLSRDNITRRRRFIKKAFENDVPIMEIDDSFVCWKGYAEHYYTYNAVQNMTELLEENVRRKRSKNVRQ